MKILQVLALALCLSLGYASSAVSASSDVPAKVENAKNAAVRHHRGMSMAMMKDLNLNDEQKKQWKELSEQKKAEIKPLREQIKKLHEQEKEINAKYEAKVKKILTKEQSAVYEEKLLQKPLFGMKKHGKRPHAKKKK